MGPSPAVAEVRRAVRVVLRPDVAVVVACSGGADSLALAAAVAFEAPRAGVSAALITVDHGLQHGSVAQAASVAELGFELGFDPVETLTVRVGDKGGPEAAARAARYAALDGAAAALDADVLLGHTLDDQAETVLLGLARGSGARSLAGMPARTGRYRRPLLGLRRATTVTACAELGLPVWDDPHNADPDFVRVRLRHEVLPLLEDVLHGGVAQALARTGALVRADLDALDAWAERAYGDAIAGGRSAVASPAGGGLEIPALDVAALDVGALAELPRAVRTRMLRRWALDVGSAPLPAERTDALDALVADWHGQGPVDLPGGVRVVRRSARLEAIRSHASPAVPTGPAVPASQE